MATSSKKTGAARKRRRKPKPDKPDNQNDHSEYVRLRTILDSLEIGAIRYYRDGKDEAEKRERLAGLEAELLPVIRRLYPVKVGIAGGCPSGYISCDGVCVPYSC
jgi:hypothetical protein